MKATQEAGSTSRSKKVREAKDFDALYEGAKHKSAEGGEGIHAAAFRNAAISACRAVGFKMTHAKLAFSVMQDGWDEVDGAPLVKILDGEAEKWVAPTRNATGVIDLRSRPMYRKWGAKLNIRYDAGMLTATGSGIASYLTSVPPASKPWIIGSATTVSGLPLSSR